MAAVKTKERPILFSGPMVRAILKGRKTQTRRVLNRMTGFKVSQFDKSSTPGYDWHFRCQRGMWQDMENSEVLSRCPYGCVGELLWLRETFHECVDEETREHIRWGYRADKDWDGAMWSPSIHMPRLASRITLEITDVRVERLQDVSPEDAIAEGITLGDCKRNNCGSVSCYRMLWESINGAGSWAANPWVWVVEFKRV